MGKNHYIIPIFVPHEGCPHNCVFCNQDHITGSTEVIDDKYAEETIQEYLKTIDSNNSTIEVSFFGGTFTAIPINKQNMLLTVAKKYKDAGKINKIRLSTRPDYIDEKILENLKAYSVDIIELGVQSMDQEVLLRAGRGHTSEHVIDASILIKQYGFTLGHQVMLGLPGDNHNKDIQTVKELVKLKPDMFRIYPALVIKDTPMEKMFQDKTYTPYDLQESIEVCKDLLGILMPNDIKVIRVGLQPTDNISEGKDIVAGPFHPAYRELVEGSLFCDMIYDFAKDLKDIVEINVNSKDISKVYTNKKQFFIDIKNKLSTVNFKVMVDDKVKRGFLQLKYNEECCNLSINDYIKNRYKEGKADNL